MIKEKVFQEIKNKTSYSDTEIDLFLTYIEEKEQNAIFSIEEMSKDLGFSELETYELLSFAISCSLLVLVYKVKCFDCSHVLEKNFINFNDIEDDIRDAKLKCTNCENIILTAKDLRSVDGKKLMKHISFLYQKTKEDVYG